MTINDQIKSAIKRSISHNEVVTMEVDDLSEAAIEVSVIADDCDSCDGIERGDVIGTDIWGNVDGEDFRLFLRN
jgi:hypothetical protein